MPSFIEDFDLDAWLDFEQWLSPPMLYFIIGGVALFILIILVLVITKKKRYFKKTLKRFQKLRLKKFNGEKLIDKIEKKRKAGSNDFKKLNSTGKKLVKKYFKHKEKELAFTATYAAKSGLRYKYRKAFLQVSNQKNGRLATEDFMHAKGYIKLTNKYACLDEVILYLDELPLKILDGEAFEVKLNDEIKLNYTIK